MYSATFTHIRHRKSYGIGRGICAANRWDVPALPLYKELLKLIQDRTISLSQRMWTHSLKNGVFHGKAFFAIQAITAFPMRQRMPQ